MGIPRPVLINKYDIAQEVFKDTIQYRSVVAQSRSAGALNRSAVALIRSIEVLIRSAVTLIRSTEVLIRDVPAYVVTEVSCHFILSLRHSYDYMCSETSYLIIGA